MPLVPWFETVSAPPPRMPTFCLLWPPAAPHAGGNTAPFGDFAGASEPAGPGGIIVRSGSARGACVSEVVAEDTIISACKNQHGPDSQRPAPAGRPSGAAHPHRAPHGSTGQPKARFIRRVVYLRGASRCAGHRDQWLSTHTITCCAKIWQAGPLLPQQQRQPGRGTVLPGHVPRINRRGATAGRCHGELLSELARNMRCC